MSGRKVAAVVVVFALALGAGRATAAADAREIKAREDFAAGRFQEALDIFARLYAETLHPIYLRNIGRCYQNLRKPDRAIATFRDYLRKHTKISEDERKEVEGFIKEMQDLEQRQREDAAQPAASPTPQPTLAAAAPAAPAETAPQAVVVGTPATEASADAPVYTKWWFWTLVGAAVVGAGLGIAAATGTFDRTENAPCPSGFTCSR
jgi:tetratricopeptide (TPR) repeat protein